MGEEAARDSGPVQQNQHIDEASHVAMHKPACPKCGWHNTRPSMTKSLLDSFLQTFFLTAYRCRACGKRFHVYRRTRAN